MRSNISVTNIEHHLDESQTIVSKTDLRGRITYANEDFSNVCGYAIEELIGAPQSIVRHPDMPREAFADLWRTIESGKAWTGLVKNRCKNGDHYWVEANVAPIFEQRKIIGYTSIRKKPSRALVDAHEQVYRAVRNGDKSLLIREGAAVPNSFMRRFDGLKNISVMARIAFSFSALALLFASTLFTPTASLPAIALLGIGLSFLFCLLLHRSVLLPMRHAREKVEQMSEGDLSGKITVDSENELGTMMQALRILQINVKLLVGQIKESTRLVNLGADDISAGNADLARRTESQVDALQKTTASMEQLTSTVLQNAANARQANTIVADTAAVAIKGGDAVNRVIETMGEIRDSSGKIVEIIGVIDDIAFQTNILALNAAVEAARAGEQGRGFAIVAGEVRNLAQRSATAAREIKSLISASVAKVETGSQQVDDAGSTMGEIVKSLHRAADIMSEITAASEEQSSGIERVDMAISEMQAGAQQNAELVEHAGATAGSMQEQASILETLVDSFKLNAELAGSHSTLRLRSTQSAQTAQAAPRRYTKSTHQAVA